MHSWTWQYAGLFTVIQIASLVLTIAGVPIVAVCLLLPKWPETCWVWFNDEDRYGPKAGYWNRFVWLALRNSVNNLRYVKGVSAVGRPLYRKTWGPKPGGFYLEFGWNNSGFPVLSAGRNVNPW